MKIEPIIVEQLLSAPIERVWKAITDRDEMKQWYFDIDKFKPEVRFEFRFYGGTEECQYLHICEVKEVVEGRKLAHSWRYDGYEGDTLLTMELFPEGTQTRIKLTHEGVGSFPQDDPNFSRESFVGGWTWIIKTSLKEFVEKQ